MAEEYSYSDEEETQEDGEKTKKAKKKKPVKPELTPTQWWRAAEYKKDPHEVLDNLAKQIEDDQSSRYEAYREYARLFSNGTAGGYSADGAFYSILQGNLTQNELANTIETLWAQVFKNKVVPAVSTSNADYDEWSRARDYSRWLEGAFDEAGVQEEAVPSAGIKALVFGTGFIKVCWDEKDEGYACIKAEEVDPRKIFVDRIEAKSGKPRTLIQKDRVDRFQLHEIYKEDREDFYGTPAQRIRGIYKCTEYDDKDLGSKQSEKSDMVVIREAWHLPSSYNSEDGRHVIWINGCTLLDEPFEWDTFPFVKIKFGPELEGFYGESAVKRLAPTQQLLDKLNRKIDEAQDVMGVPRILCQENNLPSKAEIDDIPGGIITVKNVNQIKDWNAQCSTPEMYQDRDAAPHKMRSLLGVSDFEVQQSLPQSMREFSAPAMERWVDQGQARHAMFHRELEKAIVSLAYLFMRQAEDCQEMGYKLVVASPDSDHSYNGLDLLDFEKVCVDRKRLKVRVQPMSQLPQSFAGKVDAIAKLKNEAGIMLDPKTALRMMEIPDPNQASDFMVSDEEIIVKNLNWMVKQGKYIRPMPLDNLQLITLMTTKFINHYRIREDADMNVVSMLAQYIDDATALQNGLGSPDPNAPPPISTMGALGMAPSPPTGMPPMGPPPGMQGAVPPQGLPPGPPGPAAPPMM